MEPIKSILSLKRNNVNNVFNKNDNNDNNGDTIKEGNYALNRDKFIPNSEESQLAEKIAVSLSDLENYAFYLHVVNKLGVQYAYTFWKGFFDEIAKKKDTKYEVRFPKRYFAWKFREKKFY